MTSYQLPGGLLADPYAGAFGPQAGLLADPIVLQRLALASGLLGPRDMSGDMQPLPGGSGTGTGAGGPDTAAMPGGPAASPSAGNKPAGGMPSGTQPMPAIAPGMSAAGLQAPAFAVPSAYALPISPKLSLADISAMYQPAASPDGKLPPLGLGGLRRLYASPATLAAEAEAARAAGMMERTGVTPSESGGGDGANAEGTSNANDPGSLDGDSGEGSVWRKGGFVRPDGDAKLEPRKGTLHEGEVVINPEAVGLLGRERLLAANRRALALKRRPMDRLG